MHRTGQRGLGRSYIDGLQHALADERRRTASARWMRTSRTTPTTCPISLQRPRTHDVVIGSRYLYGVSVVNWPLHRIFLSAFANRYIRRSRNLSASDCTSGFRCWRREALARLPLGAMVSDGYAFLVEMLYDAKQRGCRIGEVPIIFVERGRTVQAVIERPARIAADALAARVSPTAELTCAQVVVMVTTSYPRFPGDSVGTFMEPIAKGRRRTRARDPRRRAVASARARAPEEDGVRFHFYKYAPLPALNVFGYAAAMRADVSFAARHWRRRRWRSRREWFAAMRVAQQAPSHRHARTLGRPRRIYRLGARPARPQVVSLHGSDVYVAETFAPPRARGRPGFRRAGAITACSADLARRAIGLGADPATHRGHTLRRGHGRFQPAAGARASLRARDSACRRARRSSSPPGGWSGRRDSSI